MSERQFLDSPVRGTLRFAGHAGVNRVNFQGRISRSRRLPMGRYTVQITATNSAQQPSNRLTLNFTIVR